MVGCQWMRFGPHALSGPSSSPSSSTAVLRRLSPDRPPAAPPVAPSEAESTGFRQRWADLYQESPPRKFWPFSSPGLNRASFVIGPGPGEFSIARSRGPNMLCGDSDTRRIPVVRRTSRRRRTGTGRSGHPAGTKRRREPGPLGWSADAAFGTDDRHPSEADDRDEAKQAPVRRARAQRRAAYTGVCGQPIFFSDDRPAACIRTFVSGGYRRGA